MRLGTGLVGLLTLLHGILGSDSKEAFSVQSDLSKEYAAQVVRKVVTEGGLVHVSTLKDDGNPVSFPEYYVASEHCLGLHSSGNLVLVLMNISSTVRQYYRNGKKVSITVENITEARPAMESPRANLFGSLKKLETTQPLLECYGKKHPDTRWWLPGEDNAVHDASFYEFEVSDVYYVGGFGDQAYIGPIDGKLYHSASSGTTVDGGQDINTKEQSFWQRLRDADSIEAVHQLAEQQSFSVAQKDETADKPVKKNVKKAGRRRRRNRYGSRRRRGRAGKAGIEEVPECVNFNKKHKKAKAKKAADLKSGKHWNSPWSAFVHIITTY